jgi:hypothetical protein
MTRDLPRNDADNGEPVVPADERNWGPGGRPEHPELVVRWTPSRSLGWRAYHESMFPSGQLVTPWVRFKVMSTGVNIARRLWDQREELREAYEVEHGSDQDGWPHRHPGIVANRGAVDRPRGVSGLPVARPTRQLDVGRGVAGSRRRSSAPSRKFARGVSRSTGPVAHAARVIPR